MRNPKPKKQRGQEGRPRQTRISDFADVLVGIFVATILFFGFGERALAGFVGLASLLLASSRWVMQGVFGDLISPLKEKLGQIGEIIDLQSKSSIKEMDDIIRYYLAIREPEFLNVKDAILAESVRKLRRLAVDKTSEEMASGEYYSWLLPMLSEVGPSESIKAVSMMFNTEWDDSPAEMRFIEENLNAAQRGARVERIFVMPRDQVAEAIEIPAVSMHIKESGKKLLGFYVDLNYLRSTDSVLLREAGHGFIIIGGRVALIDKFSEGGEVRGQVTMDAAEIRRLERNFENLKLHAVEMTRNNLKNIIPD